jgi:predicted acetyltransferase
MQIDIQLAKPEEQVLLGRLMELYLYDFTEFDRADVGPDATYGYTYLPLYWTDKGRDPYLVRVNGFLAGFVLVFEYSMLGAHGHMIAEFFVMRKYRQQGVGKAVAHWIFDRYPGHWEISQIDGNIPAQNFWRRVIADYTGGNYSEILLNDENWQGPVQVFENEWAAKKV